MNLVFAGVFALFVSSTTHADLPPIPCFNLSKPPLKPLHDPLPYSQEPSADEVLTQSGKLPDGSVWGALRSRVTLPIEIVRTKLSDPVFVKENPKMKIKLDHLTRPGFDLVTRIQIKIKPVPFMSVEWAEEWALNRIANDTPTDLISYYKTEGTKHLERLCGSTLIRRIDTKLTDVFLYEEVKSSHRTEEEVVNGHQGTLRALKRLVQ